MEKDTIIKRTIHLAIATLILAVITWSIMCVLFNATEYTETTEEFTGLNLTYVNLGNTRLLITSGESVYNVTSGIILADGGTNYTMNNIDGSIQINCTSGYMVNNSVYTIDYHQGPVNPIVATTGKLLVGMIVLMVIIIIILKYAGLIEI